MRGRQHSVMQTTKGLPSTFGESPKSKLRMTSETPGPGSTQPESFFKTALQQRDTTRSIPKKCDVFDILTLQEAINQRREVIQASQRRNEGKSDVRSYLEKQIKWKNQVKRDEKQQELTYSQQVASQISALKLKEQQRIRDRLTKKGEMANQNKELGLERKALR